MPVLIVVVAFVTLAVTVARADQLKHTPVYSSCEVMPMDTIENFLFFSRPNVPRPDGVIPPTDLFAEPDAYLVVYLDLQSGLGIHCELKDCSDAEPPPSGVRFGLLNDSDFKKWKCSDTIPSEGVAKEHSCRNAKFHECSSCGTLVVSNYAGVSINAELESDPPGIFQSAEGTGAHNYYCNGKPRSCRDPAWNAPWGARDSCESVAPEGGRCYEPIAFCPDQSGVARGHLKVTIHSPARVRGRVSKTLWENTRTQLFDLVGTASYPPALEAAERVRKRHLNELMKIPHVDRVDLQEAGPNILIDVQTKGDVDEVRKTVPPSLEAYKVEVTQFIYGGHAEW